jgi:hypothetical protein
VEHPAYEDEPPPFHEDPHAPEELGCFGRGCLLLFSLPLAGFFGMLLWSVLTADRRPGVWPALRQALGVELLLMFLMVPLLAMVVALVPPSVARRLHGVIERAGSKVLIVIFVGGGLLLFSLAAVSIVQLIKLYLHGPS